MKNFVAERRRKMGMKQQELARKAGITQQSVSLIERQAAVPRVDIAIKMSYILRCPVEKLFNIHLD